MSDQDPPRAKFTTDHEVIRKWAQRNDALPASVRGTRSETNVGVIRFDTRGQNPGTEALDIISWEDFFSKFEEERLALLYQETSGEGQPSVFHRLVGRDQFHE